jgi:DNA-binding Lrp family transcriptional regulator
MDTFDITLLQALQADGRLTNFELAERVGLSASQCSRRRAALEEAGVIESYHAHLSSEALGLGVTVFIQVTLATHSPGNSQAFHQLISSLDDVQDAYSLTGEADYLIRLTVPDLKALSRILNDVFLPHESVAHVRSSIVLDKLKQTTQLPLRHLRDDTASRTPSVKTKTTRQSEASAQPAVGRPRSAPRRQSDKSVR